MPSIPVYTLTLMVCNRKPPAGPGLAPQWQAEVIAQSVATSKLGLLGYANQIMSDQWDDAEEDMTPPECHDYADIVRFMQANCPGDVTAYIQESHIYV